MLGTMPAKRRFTDAQIEAALRSQGGIQAAAAQALEKATGVRVTRQAIHERVKHSRRLRQAITETEEEVLDLAENVVLKSLNAGDFNAARFVLETRGKHRGYTRREIVALTVDPRRLSDEELIRAIKELEAITIDAEPVAAPRALPAPVKRPRR
jgi:CRP-like cAMP-binding protein